MRLPVCGSSTLAHELAEVSAQREETLSKHRELAVIEFADCGTIVYDRLRKCDSRMIVGLAGCPGSGKTTAANALVEVINNVHGAPVAVHLPMDGFHLSNHILISRGIEKLKGQPSTYDVTAYVELLRAFKAGGATRILAPDYMREFHDIVPGKISIEPHIRLLVSEGIYVGYSNGAWNDASRLLDLLFYLDMSPDICIERIISRNRRVGRSDAIIERKLCNDFEIMKRSITIIEHAHFMIRNATQC